MWTKISTGLQKVDNPEELPSSTVFGEHRKASTSHNNGFTLFTTFKSVRLMEAVWPEYTSKDQVPFRI